MSPETAAETVLLRKIFDNQASGKVVEASLSTDERVLARISDGIYRQPSSALRELVANAYDADATEVTIHTDPPRFEKISIVDNGIGMDERSLVRLIHHIGGSPKRMAIGAELGITASDDTSRTPSGRKIIGKIGIGLFSVAQLTRRFRIITKTRGSKFRLVATVTLRTYSEDPGDDFSEEQIRTGSVEIRSVAANDIKSHGTEIILDGLHASARDLLRSTDLWERHDASIDDGGAGARPEWHIGRVDPTAPDTILEPSALPWTGDDDGDAKFNKLVSAVKTALSTSGPKPNLENTFDRYLHIIWVLSLALPLDYIGGTHPFDLKGDKFTRVFLLANRKSTQPRELSVGPRTTIRQACRKAGVPLATPECPLDFEVHYDGVKLSRPVEFRYPVGFDKEKPSTYPILFIGSCTPPVEELPSETSGGRELSFEAYFLWANLIVPRDHIGVLVRIANNSGTLYDRSFFDYKVQEIVRMQKITSEVFVTRGLDAALNIDRESFNFGHPHTKIVMNWVHRALRQVTNTQKKISSDARKERRTVQVDHRLQRIEKQVQVEVENCGLDQPREIGLTSSSDKSTRRGEGELALDAESVLPEKAHAVTKGSAERRKIYEAQATAVAQLLDAHGLLDSLSYEQIESLIRSIMELFEE